MPHHTRIALITGASRARGLGQAICRELAARGIDIYFTYWTPYDASMPWGVDASAPPQLTRDLEALGVRCASSELDLMQEDAAHTLLARVRETLGEPSILINNATYSTSTDVETLSAVELDRHYRVNVRAATLLAMDFIKNFAHERGGRLITISSGQSLGAMDSEIAYALTKGAMETLTTTIAHEAMARGITVNAVNPGPTDTGWMNQELEATLTAQFPTRRVGQPEDAARLIGFLCSEEAAWITGQIIHSEGGFRRG